MEKKSVSIIGTVGLPACYGGFESLVDNITKNVSENIQYTVFCSSKSYKTKKDRFNNAILKYIPLNANGIQSIPYDILSLCRCIISKPNTVLILGVSGCMFLPIYRLFSKSRVITNIDGLEWKRDKWNSLAKKILKFSEKLAIKYSDVIIADNQAIADYILKEYNISAKVIAYGGDHVFTTKIDNNISLKEKEYYLSICRVEPENNTALILESFADNQKKLIFIGNWNNSDYGISLKNKYSKFSNIQLLDPIYDISILYQYRVNCKGYIHGHSAGGTNPSLVEAMHIAQPIIAFDCSFNRYSTENKALYFHDAPSLSNIIISSDDEMLKNNSIAMKEIALKKYKWDIITSEYEDIY
ncbi:DUF1972 domain-containing protein [Providencia huaxiensis]|uniref:DUF1972 domain-containing protein n=1 Tax=Providencia huaxiensis TaxID=2027290 RepID=UPI0034E44B62